MSDKPGKLTREVEPSGATLDEQRRCMQVVSELEACIDEQPGDTGRWVSRLVEHLPALARTMRNRFEEEKSERLYSELSRRRPQIVTRLEDLKAEHPRMLTEIDNIVDVVSGMRDVELDELRELNARIQLLVAQFRRHEAVENELIHEVYWNDIGAGD